MKKGKVYFSRKFYVGEPFKALEPDVEILALQQLILSLRARGEYEVAAIARERIDDLKREQRQQLEIPCRAVIIIRYSLS